MRPGKQLLPGALLTLLILLVGCAPAPEAPYFAARQAPAAAGPAATPKRATVAMMGNPNLLITGFSSDHQIVGHDEFTDLISRGMSIRDAEGKLIPQLAEQVPSLENGLWKLNPDGTMETIWKIRGDARWHDGTPVSSADFLLASRVIREPELPTEPPDAFNFIDTIEGPDAQTVVVRWKRPYVYADAMFGRTREVTNLPLPAHLLSKPYAESPATLFQDPYWGDGFVGTGPYVVKTWERGSFVVLTANDRYVFGRPKIDELTVKLISDANTLGASLLAGDIDRTLGRSLSLDQAAQIQGRWSGGDVIPFLSSWLAVWPQFLNPNPPVIGNVQFRRALLHAIDRQQLVDTLQYGLTSVADSYLAPHDPDYQDTAGGIVRYPYDLRQSAQLIESLGYTKGPDGYYRDAAGQRLGVELRSTQSDDLQLKTAFSTADFWQKAGVAAEVLPSPLQLQQDREYRATYPGFESVRQPNELASILRFHSSRTPLAENRFVGNNRVRYINPEFDVLVDRYQATIPRPERMQIGTQLVRHFHENLMALGLYYQAEPHFIAHRLRNTTVNKGSETWNAQEWDVQ
jgi:peptide/nickel transport system substrate-binding protein